jgi:hypothetical protein
MVIALLSHATTTRRTSDLRLYGAVHGTGMFILGYLSVYFTGQ